MLVVRVGGRARGTCGSYASCCSMRGACSLPLRQCFRLCPRPGLLRRDASYCCDPVGCFEGAGRLLAVVEIRHRLVGYETERSFHHARGWWDWLAVRRSPRRLHGLCGTWARPRYAAVSGEDTVATACTRG